MINYWFITKIAKIRKYIDTATAEVLLHSFASINLDFCNLLFYGLSKYGKKKDEIIKLKIVQYAIVRVETL